MLEKNKPARGLNRGFTVGMIVVDGIRNKRFYKNTKGLFTRRKEDARGRIILMPYVFCIQFTCKGLYLSLALAER